MPSFETKRLPVVRDTVALDGCDVRVLLDLPRGGMAHFELPAGAVSVAVTHRTVEEVWFFLRGRGRMWRRLGPREDVVDVEPGVCVTIPLGTEFQLRALGDEPLAAVAGTMPPWPGDDEARAVEGKWTPTIGR